MKTIKYFLLAFALLSIFAKCTKDPIPDPNSFYFQCKLNGNLYIPDNCANCTTADFYGDTAFILGGNSGFAAISIAILDLDNVSNRDYVLNNRTLQNKKGGGGYKNSTLTYDRFDTDATHTGLLTISSIDKTNRIIQGTFYYKAYNAYRNDSVNITDGKFRLKYTR